MQQNLQGYAYVPQPLTLGKLALLALAVYAGYKIYKKVT